MIRAAMCTCALAALLPSQEQPAKPAAPPQQPVARTSVGMPVALTDLVLPGSELEPAPATAQSKAVVRIDAVSPHGTAHRYDPAFTGLEAGSYDLRQFLQRKDRTPATDLPTLLVQVDQVLPPGKVEPNHLDHQVAPSLGGYRTLLWIAGGAWVAALLAVLFVGRRRRTVVAQAVRPVTLAERLRPLVEEAIAGRLPQDRRAELERLLLGYWRERLGLRQHRAAEAIALLRADAEAGVLLRQLEAWLHAPPRDEAVDLDALLRPYANLPADAAQSPAATGTAGGGGG